MALLVGRVLLVVVAAVIGLALAGPAGLPAAAGAGLGALAAVVAVAAEIAAGAAPLRPLVWTAGGGLLGLLAGLAFGLALAPLSGGAAPMLRGLAALLGAWVGAVVAARRAPELSRPSTDRPAGPARVLDTSALVDGRVADVAAAGFLDGVLIVPQFVVRELQYLADAADPLRRHRGRRGFDILQRLQAAPGVQLDLVDTDFPDIADVDGKLVALARTRDARLVTCDAALARVAGLAGVGVARLVELANAMRPVALPGEGMQVQVLREGKEAGQGVGYLEDGTMVVIEGGKRYIGQPLDVVVTSVLQTASGRMIFTRPRGDEAGPRDA